MEQSVRLVLTGLPFPRYAHIHFKVLIFFRDHEFDRRAQKKGRLGKMSKSHETKRGVQSVRSDYGADESKILPSLLDAIPDEELESIK